MITRARSICVLAIVFMVGACASTAGLERTSPELTAERLMEIGESFLAAGDSAQALSYLLRALSKKPNSPRIHYDLGLAYKSRGMPDEALKHLREALHLKPDYGDAQNALGVFLTERGKLDEAEKYLREAIANPFYQTPHYACFNLGRVYEQRGDLDKALNSYQEAIRIKVDYYPAYMRMGGVFERLGRLNDALRCYRLALRYRPESILAHFKYGEVSYSLGYKQTARREFEKVMEEAPESDLAAEARKFLKSF